MSSKNSSAKAVFNNPLKNETTWLTACRDTGYLNHEEVLLDVFYDITSFGLGLKRNVSTPIGNKFLVGPTGVGKALPLEELVLTPKGYVKNKSLKLNDLVIGSNGDATSITGIYPQGVVDIYKITFKDGRSVECCGDHQWFVFNKHWANKWKVFNTNQIINFIKEKKQLYIPLTKEVNYPEIDLPIKPYLLGALIGDGYLKKSCSFSNIDKELIARVNIELNAVNGVLNKSKSLQGTADFSINAVDKNKELLKSKLQTLGLYGKTAQDKFIPSVYKTSSIEQRQELLKGLIDTDGFVTKTGSISFTTISKQLALDVQELVWSLGGIASISEKKKNYTYLGEKKQGKLAYQVNIRIKDTISLTYITRKKNRASINKQYSNKLKLEIKTVEFIGKKEAQCISVAADDSLFVVKDYIVTHNTKLVETIAAVLHNSESNVLKVNCGEYQLEHEVARLIGAPPGYLGHRETPPVLSQSKINAVASGASPVSIVLFDEIEKGAKSLYNLLLGILDKGSLALGDGTQVTFKNTLIFFTSNIGVKVSSNVGILPNIVKITDKNYKDAVKRYFSPEFIGRVGIRNIYAFEKLTEEDLRTIILFEIKHMVKVLAETHNIYTTDISKDVYTFIMEKSEWEQYGGRSVAKTVYEYVTKSVVKFLLSIEQKNSTPKGIAIYMDHGEVKTVFDAKKLSA